MVVAGIEIKISTMHVEADIGDISGRGFDSPRLQSTGRKCAATATRLRPLHFGSWFSLKFCLHGRPRAQRRAAFFLHRSRRMPPAAALWDGRGGTLSN